MFNTAVNIIKPTWIVPRRKGKPKEKPVMRLNFIKVSFMFVNILPEFHRNFYGCDNIKSITEIHFGFLLAE